MDIITELLRTVGLPAIIGFVVWLIKLEAKTKHGLEKIDILWKETERLEEKFELSKVSLEKKLTETLDRLSDSIGILTTATTKHQLMLESMTAAVHELKDDIRNRPCVSHSKHE